MAATARDPRATTHVGAAELKSARQRSRFGSETEERGIMRRRPLRSLAVLLVAGIAALA